MCIRDRFSSAGPSASGRTAIGTPGTLGISPSAACICITSCSVTAVSYTHLVTETRPVRNTRTGAAAGSSGTGSTSYGRTDGTRPRTGTGAGNGPRSGAELQGVSDRSRTGGSRNRAGSNTNTGSRRRNPQSTRRSYGGSSILLPFCLSGSYIKFLALATELSMTIPSLH